jgi:hypothetical protein
MKTTFSSLLVNSWNLILNNKKPAGIIFLYQFIPPLLFFFTAFAVMIFVVFFIPFFGINLKNIPIGMLFFQLTNPIILSLILIGWLVVILIALTFQLVCSYLARLWLSYLVQKKKFNFRSLLSEWKGMWHWAGTGLATSVYFIAIIVVTAMLMVASFYVYDMLVIVPAFLGVWCIVFISISLAFTFPVYFFEWKKYFAATERSREIVKNRWWSIFGQFLLLWLAIIIVSLILFLIENGLWYGINLIPQSFFDYRIVGIIFAAATFFYMIMQSAINIVIQLFAILFTFELYMDSKRNIVLKK